VLYSKMGKSRMHRGRLALTGEQTERLPKASMGGNRQSGMVLRVLFILQASQVSLSPDLVDQ
jgi:hypothetical protein